MKSITKREAYDIERDDAILDVSLAQAFGVGAGLWTVIRSTRVGMQAPTTTTLVEPIKGYITRSGNVEQTTALAAVPITDTDWKFYGYGRPNIQPLDRLVSIDDPHFKFNVTGIDRTTKHHLVADVEEYEKVDTYNG